MKTDPEHLKEIAELYQHFHGLTDESISASNLVLATILSNLNWDEDE